MDGPTFVIDNGACRCRVGLAGDAQPRATFQNALAKPKADTRLLVGCEIDEARCINQLNLRRPFDRGYVINWSMQGQIWSRMLDHFMPEVATAGAHLVMTEPLFNLTSIRRATLEIAFESFGFESLFSAPAPQFAVHKWAADNPSDPVAQSLSGVVLDAGYSFTHAVPIFDGRVQLAAVQRVRLGGKLLTNLMKEWVSYRSMNLKDEAYLVEIIKDQLAYVALDARAEMARAMPKKHSQVAREVVLPDGIDNARGIVRDPRDPRVTEAKRQLAESGAPPEAILHVNNERFMVPEALFCPSDINVDQAGACEAVANAVSAAHPVFRPLLTQNVLLTGGTSSCPGFRERVVQDLRPLLDTHHVMHVNQAADPAGMAWQGASVCGASGFYRDSAITRQAYAEMGADRAAAEMAARA